MSEPTASPAPIYFDVEEVKQALHTVGISSTPQDAGLAWIVLAAEQPAELPGVHFVRRFNLTEIIFPKVPFAIQLDSALHSAGFSGARLARVNESFALLIGNPQDCTASLALRTLEKIVPGYRLKNLVVLSNHQFGIHFEADLTLPVKLSVHEPPLLGGGKALNGNEVYEIWTDASFDPKQVSIVGYGIVIKSGGQIIKTVADCTTGTQAQAEYIAAEKGLLQVERGTTCKLHVDAQHVYNAINTVLTSPANKPVPNIKALPSLVAVLKARNVQIILKHEAESVEIKQAHFLANEGRQKPLREIA